MLRETSRALLAGGVLMLTSCGSDGPIPGPDLPCPPLCAPEPGAPYQCEPGDTAALASGPTGALFVPEGTAPAQWIVRLSPAAPQTLRGALGIESQAQSVETFVAQFAGVEFVTSMRAGIVVRGGVEELLGVLGNPGVASVHADTAKSIPTPPDPERIESVRPAADWDDQDRHDQEDLPLDGRYEPGAKGAGVLVGVVDTGSSPHPDYDGRRIEWCHTSHTFGGCTDRHGHGTHVATNAVGTTLGIAPEAQLASVRVLNEQGSGTDSDVIRGIEAFTAYCVENDLRCVGNMSLGGGVSVPLADAVRDSYLAGVAWAVAAGNDSADACDGTPSNVDCVLTTAAFDHRDDESAYFTNVGACVDGYAAGVNTVGGTPQGGTTTMSGTSMASPQVAGILAAVWSAHPDFTVAELYQYVLDTRVLDTLTGVDGETVNGMFYVREE